MSRVLTDSLTHAYAECEKPNHHLIPSMTIFQTKAFYFINQNHWTVSNTNLHCPSCVCSCIYGPRILEFTPQDVVCLSDIFYRLSPLMIMSNLNKTRFSPWDGIYPNLLHPTHIFSFFKNRATHFGRCPILPSRPSNTKHGADHPCISNIPSNTKHNVDCYLALTTMPCDVLVRNAMQSCHCLFIPCYIHKECYMCMPTHA